MATLPNKRIRKRIYWCHRHAMDVLQNLADHVVSCLEPEEVLSEKCSYVQPDPKERFSRTWISGQLAAQLGPDLERVRQSSALSTRDR